MVAVVLILVGVVGEFNGDDQAPAAKAADAAATATPSAQVSAGGPSPSSSTTDGMSPAPSASAAAGAGGGTDAFSDDPAATNASAAAAEAAAGFVSSWARPDRTVAQWAAGVKPKVTAEAWKGLSTTKPANTPKVTVSGEPVEVAINAEAAVFDVPTTGDFVRVHLALNKDTGAWLVSSVEPA